MAQVGILRVHEIDNICPKTGKIFIREREREGEKGRVWVVFRKIVFIREIKRERKIKSH